MIKEISIPIENDYLVEKNEIVNLFSAFFNDEFSFDFVDNSAEIQLTALDYNQFQYTADKILRNGALNENSKKVVQNILDSITNIKSYGLRSGKRVYASADDNHWETYFEKLFNIECFH